jgi:hypothetical protein
MSAPADRSELSPARRRRLVGLGLLRPLATTVVLAALYYLLPLDHIKNVPLTLVAGMLILLAVAVWQVRGPGHLCIRGSCATRQAAGAAGHRSRDPATPERGYIVIAGPTRTPSRRRSPPRSVPAERQ